jgi:long-subunit fatty acid transport protein
MRLSILIFSICIILASPVFAQSGYYEDAYRFSNVIPSGSARIMGVGGTQWSLGGDVSNIAGNPAGLGFFRNSEASATLGYTDWGVETLFMGQSKSYNTTNFALPNVSYVHAKPKDDYETGSFKGGSFGIGFQRIANFNTEFGYFSDELGTSSIIDFYLQDSYGVPETQIEGYGLTGLAYQTYQINPVTVDENGNEIPNPNTYDSFVLGLPFQDENVTQEGSANQFTLSYGANFNHKLFLGGSLGIRTFNFESRKFYNEEFVDEPLANSSLQEYLFIDGGGVNINLGIIYKPIEYINLGFTFQSPTWFGINEEYSANIVADYNNYYFAEEDITLGRQEAVTDVILSAYNLNTPIKIGGGATYFFGKNGFISADVDWVDYSQAKLNSNDFDEGPDNQAIKSVYTSTVNYRFGAEYKINTFRLRGGYSFFGDPYSDSSYDRSTQQISGGVGVKLNNFTVDFALVNRKFNALYSSYQVLDSDGNNFGPLTEIENNIINGVLTFGFSF